MPMSTSVLTCHGLNDTVKRNTLIKPKKPSPPFFFMQIQNSFIIIIIDCTPL